MLIWLVQGRAIARYVWQSVTYNPFWLTHTISVASGPPKRDEPPKDVPPPTPVNLPQCQPQLPEFEPEPVGADSTPVQASPHLTAILQSLTRPADQVDLSHLQALGVHVNPDASLAGLVPDSSCLPDFDKWDVTALEDANDARTNFQPLLSNGKLAPGAAKYLSLRQSLLIDNDSAFGAVRRVAPKPGEKPVRLGYCHEFFRNLELLTGFWDDTSKQNHAHHHSTGDMPAADADVSSGDPAGGEDQAWCRTSTGSAMPAQYRTQLLTSFLKLVTYDFSCNIMSRQEPRLYIQAPWLPAEPSGPVPARIHSYFSSGCNFIFRMANDRESARAGIVEGPIAAVSPRHTTNFPPNGRDRESLIDLCRELIAALITAQHRAREGRKEERIGKDAWWTTRRRWGGGPGGPVGKEAEALESRDAAAVLVGDKDERPVEMGSSAVAEGLPPDKPAFRGSRAVSSTASPKVRRPSSSRTTVQPPEPKRPRRGMAIYDAYRMVRPPSLNWDPKTKYTQIGRQRGVGYDDVFVISSLLHHVSMLRIRVPDRLLQVLAGAPDQHGRDWGRLEVWRTKWYDFFVPEDRALAMKVAWGVMAYAMRKVEDGPGEGDDMEVDEAESARGGKGGDKANGQASRG
ncbi:hypothetical protein VSDG_08341 [Cytospora chrysosperma]|uniref:Uncharacterized protein n=1 Tax=Cytospora chrysosperma TaxID=252740 RepID=A0A423VI85_CYTCH|nr:hypothetical protein VSDG_08341 [Valsa sordida]